MPPRRAWAAPAAVAAGIVAALLAPHAFAADPHPRLPHRSVKQLIRDVERSEDVTLSGSFRTVADLGLPKLPEAQGSGNLWERVATGTALWHVWAAGPTRQRIALLGEGREIDAVDDDGLFWSWDSTTQTATRILVRLSPAAGGKGAGTRTGTGTGTGSTPPGLARRLLRSRDSGTSVRVGPTGRVAGRPTYTLDLDPRPRGTLIGRIAISVDAATGVPLQVQLFGRGGSGPTAAPSPAFTSGFTSVSFARPAAAEFRFRPPPGARVRTVRLATALDRGGSAARIAGSGWTSVLITSGRPVRETGLLRDATAAVPGGRLLSTRLFTVLLRADGTTLAGAVPAARLEQLAAGLPARTGR